jgi:pimeloyl-ACP methyl ester carboxylesterase
VARWGRGLDAAVLLEIGAEAWLLTVREGVVTAARPGPFVMRAYDIAIRCEPEAWARFLAPDPAPGWHDLMALRRRGALVVEGDLTRFFAHLQWFKNCFALLREAAVTQPRDGAAVPAGAESGFEPIIGRYLRLEIGGRPHRVYVEQAGPQGEDAIPLLLLHTAGSDGRQWRDLLNDAEVTSRFRCIAFDMPWHGKSSPPEGWQEEEYRLTTAAYTGMVMAVARALKLDRPIVIGCSIGGRIVLDLAAEHGRDLRGVIGLQSGAFLSPYYDIAYLHHPHIHGGEVCAAVVSGLVSPKSPEAGRWETLWHYMQGGPGVFKGDLHFYKTDGDLRPKLGRIDTATCPVLLLSGDYDYSCTPEDTGATAAAIKGAKATIMPGLAGISR